MAQCQHMLCSSEWDNLTVTWGLIYNQKQHQFCDLERACTYNVQALSAGKSITWIMYRKLDVAFKRVRSDNLTQLLSLLKVSVLKMQRGTDDDHDDLQCEVPASKKSRLDCGDADSTSPIAGLTDTEQAVAVSQKVDLNSTESDRTNGDSDDEGNSEVTQRHLKEGDVGITEYISSHPGFTGILKQRFVNYFLEHQGPYS